MFYTYSHQKIDDGKIFYIGKGKGNRAFSENRRNKYWKSIVANHGFLAEILAVWKTEQEALDHEKLLILCFKDMGYKLANLTDGGEGSSGLKQSEETKAKRSAALKVRQKPIEEMMNAWKANTGRKPTQATRLKISLAKKGKPSSFKGKKHSEEAKAKMSKAAKLVTNRNISGLKNQKKDIQ